MNPQVKVPGIVAGMIGGGERIDELGLLRRGGVGRLVGGVRGRGTLGPFVRAFNFLTSRGLPG